jgi:uncharacterized oligopeptide transporter (OPT) family protein
MIPPLTSGPRGVHARHRTPFVPAWHLIIWTCVVSILGVLVAFPMKRRFINEEQMPFPEGRASGVVLDALYTGGAAPACSRRSSWPSSGSARRPTSSSSATG